MECTAFHKKGLVRTASKGSLSQVLLLVFFEVCTTIELSHTYHTPKHFLDVWCSLVLSQMKYVFQDWTTTLTEVGILG